MKAHITFDTLEFADDLKKGGFKPEEAETVAKAIAKAFTQMIDTKEVATKSDIKELKAEIKELELRMVIKLGSLMVIGMSILGYVLKH